MYRVAHHDQTVKGKIAFFFPVIRFQRRLIAGMAPATLAVVEPFPSKIDKLIVSFVADLDIAV